jgi:hypothetical protein
MNSFEEKIRQIEKIVSIETFLEDAIKDYDKIFPYANKFYGNMNVLRQNLSLKFQTLGYTIIHLSNIEREILATYNLSQNEYFSFMFNDNYKKFEDKILLTLKKKNGLAKQQIKDIKAEIGLLDNDYNNLNKQIVDIESKLQEAKHNNDEILIGIENYKNALDDEAHRKKLIKNLNYQLDKTIKAEEKNKNLDKLISNIKKKIDDTNSLIDEKNRENDNLKVELHNLSEKKGQIDLSNKKSEKEIKYRYSLVELFTKFANDDLKRKEMGVRAKFLSFLGSIIEENEDENFKTMTGMTLKEAFNLTDDDMVNIKNYVNKDNEEKNKTYINLEIRYNKIKDDFDKREEEIKKITLDNAENEKFLIIQSNELIDLKNESKTLNLKVIYTYFLFRL